MTSPFELLSNDGGARRGRCRTAHGAFETPNFMPIATQGSVKGVDAERLKELGAQIILVNSYHLLLRPGVSRMQELGGIHRFSGWDGPILSDSGGFQVFSLRGVRTVTEDGVEFRSHIDGAKHFLTPEVAIRNQENLGVDIAMSFDECPAYERDPAILEASLERTLRWAARGIEARQRKDMLLFGITQGGIFRDLRNRAAEVLTKLPFDGYAIGGLSVGEPTPEMDEVLEYHPASLPANRVRYLMGVGTPRDIVQAVSAGIDLFDCVIPTRSGRFSRAYVKGNPPFVNVRNARYANSTVPLEDGCPCLACRRYTLGYLHHLFRVDEMLGPILLSIHNLQHYLDLMGTIRKAIENRAFAGLHQSVMRDWNAIQEP